MGPNDNGTIHTVGIGGLIIAQQPDKLRTVLGSCVGIAVYDPQHKVGGLAHSILPEVTAESTELGKFADQAVDNLIVQLLSNGANKQRLVAKLVGGATMFGSETRNGLGDRNVESARQRLEQNDIPVLAVALGGTKGRKMMFDPATGATRVDIIGETAETI